jgi:hypothetical protein
MKYKRLLNCYSLTVFLNELNKIKYQSIDAEEREEKLRFIRFVTIMFQLKIKCLKNPDYRPGEWKEVQYVNMLSFFGTRDIYECEKKLIILMKKWKAITANDMGSKAKTIVPEISYVGEE